MNQKSGILILDKPKSISTNNLIQQVKKKLNIKKVGHCGTLDPLATGVVICLVNNATKISDYLLNNDKRYIVTLKLFAQTSSYDAETEIIKTEPSFEIDQTTLNNVINKYNNYTYDQTPPIYSAIKVDGKKLYEYALENKTVDIKSRTITIYETKFLNYDNKNHEITLDVYCSKGTYIRSLAVDIAKDLNTISYVKELRRTKSGSFDITKAQTIDQINWDNLITMYDAIKLSDYKIINYDDILSVKQGKKIKLDVNPDLVFISDKDNNLISCYERSNDDIFKTKRGGLDN
ncbi:tRNA pseudouridine(55) synthase TruB [Mycoplasma yeatsii]|uniref:tRNA pseudouridine synthase B n=1 Tax=Mycoplasma yeatsii TaxID=51365 RepID=A0ABU0NF95_9MOLU|nr:tRNA pseudouridine(55) synthase TruB [Mycoplasma yeatsii]AJM71752.1 tRNA pseudouridine synthase B [Mycoplasma yeatsii GM274B]MDQ0568121.1 tRNA pseudouridine55 synthase [Mycoplasma yeatsii]